MEDIVFDRRSATQPWNTRAKDLRLISYVSMGAQSFTHAVLIGLSGRIGLGYVLVLKCD